MKSQKTIFCSRASILKSCMHSNITQVGIEQILLRTSFLRFIVHRTVYTAVALLKHS